MSEYQYYEWLAIDRPLNDKQLAEVDRLSSHMDIVTPTQAVVTYSFGDFKHDPLKVLACYFDAFLYAANWGTRTLAFRFATATLSLEEIEPYLIEDVVTLHREDSYTLLEMNMDDSSGSSWVDVEGMLGQIAAVRQQIIDGDYRALYLIWLAPVKGPSTVELRAAIARLPRDVCDTYLLRLLDNEPQLSSALRRELKLAQHEAPKSEHRSRTAQTLRADAKRIAEEVQRREQELAEAAHIAALEKLANREESAWQAVEILLTQQKASSYDAAVRQLVDLRDLAQHRGSLANFSERIAEITARYGKSRALMNRLIKARLI